jgi:hypothetical protein
MSDPLVLSLISKGSPTHRRFLIANQFQQVYTGDDWSFDEDDGLLFSKNEELGIVCNKLLKESTEGKTVFKFTAPVEVEIRSDEVPCILDLQFWLMQAARLYVDYQKCDPIEDGVILLSIDWTKMLEEE